MIFYRFNLKIKQISELNLFLTKKYQNWTIYLIHLVVASDALSI